MFRLVLCIVIQLIDGFWQLFKKLRPAGSALTFWNCLTELMHKFRNGVRAVRIFLGLDLGNGGAIVGTRANNRSFWNIKKAEDEELNASSSFPEWLAVKGRYTAFQVRT